MTRNISFELLLRLLVRMLLLQLKASLAEFTEAAADMQLMECGRMQIWSLVLSTENFTLIDGCLTPKFKCFWRGHVQ